VDTCSSRCIIDLCASSLSISQSALAFKLDFPAARMQVSKFSGPRFATSSTVFLQKAVRIGVPELKRSGHSRNLRFVMPAKATKIKESSTYPDLARIVSNHFCLTWRPHAVGHQST
jgi:hypothetical protein